MLLMQHSGDDTRDKSTTGTEKQDRDDKDSRWGLRALYEPTDCVQLYLYLECFASLKNICVVR